MSDTFDPIKLGPCVLTYGSFNIDMTVGGVTMRVEPKLKEIKVDQYGDSVVDHRIIGWDVRAIVPMAETDLNALKSVAVFLDHVEDVSGAEMLTDKKLASSLRKNAQELVLHPTEAEDTSEDVTLYLCAPSTPMEMGYNYENERIYNVEFVAYPKVGADPSKAGNFFSIGDRTADPTLYALTFTAQNAALEPVADVEIVIAGVHTRKITNADGQAVFYLIAGDYSYMAVKDGYDVATGTVTIATEDVGETVSLTAST